MKNKKHTRVSTVFLGLDHNFGMGKKSLFETMVFDDTGRADVIDRYATWTEAHAGHNKCLKDELE